MTTPSGNKRIEPPISMMDVLQFQRLVSGLRNENRYHLSAETDRFVSGLVRYAQQEKTISFQAGTIFWRARAHELQQDAPIELAQLGAPPAHKAGHGRLNPRGIPYLYLASDELTAISEVRPWKGLRLTLAEFRATRELRVANFTRQSRFERSEHQRETAAELTWRVFITRLFSSPFDPRDDTAYVPTQYIAERIKAANFDGIAYDSALHVGGYNVALFDTAAAIASSRKIAEVKEVIVRAELRDIAPDRIAP